MRTCPVAAENTEENLLLKKLLLSFQGTVATFHRPGGQNQNRLCQISRLLTLSAYSAEQGLCNSRASVRSSTCTVDQQQQIYG